MNTLKVEERRVCSACGQVDGEHLSHCRIFKLETDLAAAQARIKALEGDAARYRWLRDQVDPDAYYEMGVLFDMDKPDEIDAAIDASIAARKEAERG